MTTLAAIFDDWSGLYSPGRQIEDIPCVVMPDAEEKVSLSVEMYEAIGNFLSREYEYGGDSHRCCNEEELYCDDEVMLIGDGHVFFDYDCERIMAGSLKITAYIWSRENEDWDEAKHNYSYTKLRTYYSLLK